MRIFLIIYVLLTSALSFSCKKTNHNIEIKALQNTIIAPNNQQINTQNKEVFSCTFNQQCLNQNIQLSYDDAIIKLNATFDSIAQLSFNRATKTYLKCLTIASFASSLFSSQFLGSKFGLSNHKISIANWQNMSLAQRYQQGNDNTYPTWCGDRSAFYIKLLDSLLHIKATEVSIPGIHTYPIITIENNQYIIDPYDLFVAIDTIKGEVVDYESLKNKIYKSLVIYDVKHEFGKCVELISDSLYNNLLLKYGQTDTAICALISTYFKTEGTALLNQSTICKPYTPINNTFEICAVNSPQSGYAITSEFKFNSTKHHLPNFFRQYFGYKCN